MNIVFCMELLITPHFFKKILFFSKAGQLAYMDDFMGYHQVGNPDKSQPAVTLHLYIPPFKKCKIWPNASEASKSSASNMCYYTKYGLRAKCGANI